MKKLFISFAVIVSVFSVFAQPAAEIENNVKLAVMQGPTGFSSVMLPDYVNISVFASPDEAASKLVNGEIDMAVLPANAAVNLYNKGVGIRFVAIVGEGMLSVIGSDIDSPDIMVPGAGGTPDHMATILYPQYNRIYSVSSPAQVAQLLIAGKSRLALLPQPFVNMGFGSESERRDIVGCSV